MLIRRHVMPPRNKRGKPGDFDPTKSDSEDETYGTSTSKPLKSRSYRSQHGSSARKRQRRRQSGDDSDEDIIEESDLSGNVTEEDIEDNEEVEVGPSGRPKRRATKNQPKYEEESDSGEFTEAAVEVEQRKKRQTKQTLIIKLKATPRSVRRATGARSGSVSNSRPTSSYNVPFNTRRSSRIAHDETEPVVALTNSGHHVDVLRAGTRSPPPTDVRPMRGGKSVKKAPASSIVNEESQESSTRLDEEYLGANEPPVESYREIAASREDLGDEGEVLQQISSDHERDQREEAEMIQAEATDDVAVIPESGAEDDHNEDEDDDPISKPRRKLRQQRDGDTPGQSAVETTRREGTRSKRHQLRSTLGKRKTRSSQRSTHQESSDFEPGVEEGAEEDVSDSSAPSGSPPKAAQHNEDDDSSPHRRAAKRRKVNPRSQQVSDERDSEVAEELADELDELKSSRSRRAARAAIIYDDRKTRNRKPVDYRILRPDLNISVEDDGEPSTATPTRKGRGGAGGAWQRTLYSTYGPFGGAGGPTPVFGGPGGIGAAAGADSDSSDDENMQRPRVSGLGGTVGMTPTTAHPAGLSLFPPPAGQLAGGDALQGPSGTPANLGKVKDKSALADADPLGVDQNVNFDSVGGLQGHIDQLKEMVALPLLYPEVFQRFHVTPPRGVLFHGPPGTGKTLLARALASSVSSQGRKVTFYMRKGADALSKWVGEAERQLRLLFEEARKNQPSIIFFDEIDGKE